MKILFTYLGLVSSEYCGRKATTVISNMCVKPGWCLVTLTNEVGIGTRTPGSGVRL